MTRGKILYILTGSIAVYKSAFVISRLVQAGYVVQTVVSPSASHFIGPATLEGLTHRPVLDNLFSPGQGMSHIDLVKWADLTIVAPATANTINGLAHGAGSQLHTALFLAHDWSKPYLLAPAMNSNMYHHPATQAALKKLVEWGVIVLPVATGNLACGDEGSGKMTNPENILSAIHNELSKNSFGPPARKKILITAGGTREYLDAVRFIGNISTGYSGAVLADYFTRLGADVHYLHGEQSQEPELPCHSDSFTSTRELQQKLGDFLNDSTLTTVIHMAAVSDFIPESITIKGIKNRITSTHKISSAIPELEITVAASPKLIDSVKLSAANPDLKLVAFKLTANAEPAEIETAARQLIHKSQADVVVCNDIQDRVRDRQNNYRVFTRNDQEKGKRVNSLSDLGAVLATEILLTTPEGDK